MLHRLGVLTIVLLLVGVSGVAYAQGTATLRGEVSDNYGSAIPAAEVFVTNNATGAEVTASTDAVGGYALTLEPGTYTVTVEASGFEPASASNVELMAGQSVLRNFSLELGAVTTSIVVVGSRAEPRSATESTVPVDVIRPEDFSNQGSRDLAAQLRTVIPSFNINTQPISDAATVVRPANLRNLAPDHTLILVNGKRRHRSAVITWLGNGIADGSQGPDISTIPSIAIRQAEVLRDGAAAQYGSDAIAGVINFQLKNAPSGGSLEVQTGGYLNSNPGDPATCGSGIIGDIKHSCNGIGGHGQNLSVAANIGMPLGSNGFINLSMEYGHADPTNRAIQRQDASRHHQRGQYESARHGAGLGIAENQPRLQAVRQTSAIMFDDQLCNSTVTATTRTRKVTGGFYFRNPHTRGGVFRGPSGRRKPYAARRRPGLGRYRRPPARFLLPDGSRAPAAAPSSRSSTTSPIAGALSAVEADPNCFTLHNRFPGGFTPQFGGDLIDYSLVGGLRGFASNGFTWDASASIGTSEIDQFIFDTVNASLGSDTPTSFRPGVYRQEETNLNFDVSYPLNEYLCTWPPARSGGREEFTIGAGDQPSWEIGPYAAQGFSSGSNGFNGYRADTTAGVWRPQQHRRLWRRRVHRPGQKVDARHGRPVRELRRLRQDGQLQGLRAPRS